MQRSSTLENEPIRVEKIGGDDAFRMRQTVDAIKKNIGIGVYVFSAFKDSSQETFFNTTNALISLGDFVSQKDFVSVFSKLNELSTFYTHAIQREWQSDSHIQEKVLAKCWELFTKLRVTLQALETQCESTEVLHLPSERNDYSFTLEWVSTSLLWWGEILTAELYSTALEDTIYVDTRTPTTDKVLNTEEIYIDVAGKVASVLQQGKVAIVPGYVEWIPGGIFALCGRWYSDVTTSQILSGLRTHMSDQEFIFAIKKLFVICSADPRIVGIDYVRQIRSLSLRLLLEMIGARGAGSPFINAGAVDTWAFEAGQKILLYSQDDPIGTTISLLGNPESQGVLFIQKKSVEVITLESYHMWRPGYLTHAAGFFSTRNIPINNITSSETAITFTINTTSLSVKDTEKLSKELEQEMSIFEKVFPESKLCPQTQFYPLSEIYIGWENIDTPGVLARITSALSKANINIASNTQPFHPRVIILGIERDRADEAVKLLHAEFIQ